MRRAAILAGSASGPRFARAVLTRPWIGYPAVVALVAVLYLAGPLNAGPVFNLLGASSAVAVACGARRHRPRGQLAWYLIAFGQALFVVADVLAYNYERLFGERAAVPIDRRSVLPRDVPCLTRACSGCCGCATRRVTGAGLIDALVVAIGFGTLSWAYLMAPYAHDDELERARASSPRWHTR